MPKSGCFDFISIKIKAATLIHCSCRDLLGQGLAYEPRLVENGIPPQLDDAPQGLKEDAAVHLARALNTVDKHDGDFLDGESHAMGCKLHLDLESIALELDGIEIEGL